MPSMLFGDNGIFSQNQYNNQAVQAAPGVINPAGVAGLQSTASLLGQQANGGGPNLAGQQLQTAQNQNAAQALGLAASMRGVSPGAALYASQQSLASGNQAAANAAAQARLAQQLGAENQMGQVYGQIGQQGLQAAQLGQQNSQFNAGAQNAMTQQQNAGIQGSSLSQQNAVQGLVSNGASSLESTLGGAALPSGSLAPGGAWGKAISNAAGVAAMAKGGIAGAIAESPTRVAGGNIAGEAGPEAIIPLARGGAMVHVPHDAFAAMAAGIADLSARVGKLEGGKQPSAETVKSLGKKADKGGKVLPLKKAA